MEARRKLSDEEKKLINEMPKVVLHLHLDGSLRPATVKEWLNELNDNPQYFLKVLGSMNKDDRSKVLDLMLEAHKDNKFDINSVKQCLMVDKDCRDLNQYLEKFHLPCFLLQSAEHIERSVYELYEDLSKQGVIYGEVRFAPSLHTKAGLSYNQIVEAAIKGLERAKKDFDIDGNLILCAMRGNDEENRKANFETVKVAKRYLKRGVCALDIAGAEALFPTKNFEDIFTYANDQGVPFTIHAGEAAGKLPSDDEKIEGPKSIWDAISYGAKRIGHGVQCIHDEELINYLREKEIPLEVCVGSNLQTQATPDSEPHPLEQLYRVGIKTTINSDNDTVSNTNIIDEYKYVLEHTGLTIEDILQMNINAARAIFETLEKKAELVGKINSYRNNLKEKEPLTK